MKNNRQIIFSKYLPTKDKRCRNSIYIVKSHVEDDIKEYIVDGEGNSYLRECTGCEEGYKEKGLDSKDGTIKIEEKEDKIDLSIGDIYSKNIKYTKDDTRNLEEVLGELYKMRLGRPVYGFPEVKLNIQDREVEIGSTISQNVSIQYIQHDGGRPTKYRIIQNDREIFERQNKTITVKNITKPVYIRGEVEYNEGECKTDDIGQIDCEGRIPQGIAETDTVIITPKKKIFYGPSSKTPTKSSDIRQLPGSSLGEEIFEIVTGTVNTIFIIALPKENSIKKIIDLNNAKMDITKEYIKIKTDFLVKDAGGEDRQYDIYELRIDVPYLENTKHLIKIK